MECEGAQGPMENNSFLTSVDFDLYGDFADLDSAPSNETPLPQLDFSAGGASATAQVRGPSGARVWYLSDTGARQALSATDPISIVVA